MLGTRPKPPMRRRPEKTPAKKPVVLQYYRGRSGQSTQETDGPKRQARARTTDSRIPGILRSHVVKLPFYISCVGIAVSLVYCSIIGNTVTVVTPAEALHERSFYEAKAGEVLNDALLNHSKLTIDIRRFKADLLRELPEASEVTVNIPFVGKKPIVGLTMVRAKYVLRLPDTSSYVIGVNGVVLADTKVLKPERYKDLPILQEDIPLQITVGKPIMAASDVAFIETVTRELNRGGTEVELLELPVGASELYVHTAGAGYLIKFSMNGNARQQVGAYLAVKNKLGSAKPTAYVDVRVGERVYVK